jgi:hypothetical protein
MQLKTGGNKKPAQANFWPAKTKTDRALNGKNGKKKSGIIDNTY